MLKILAWNIQQGGGSRCPSIVKKIFGLKPNMIVLSEYKNNDRGLYLREQMLRGGYRFHAVTPSAAQDNSVAIFSNLPCDTVLHPHSDADYPHNIVEVRTDVFRLIGVYLPHKKKHRLFEYIQSIIADSTTPYVITGDYNTGINHIDQEGTSFWYQSQMEAFSELEYIDAFRQIHGNVKEYSWYSHQGNGYRYDHYYIHRSLVPVVRSCEYIHAWREEKIADHSPMVLCF